MVDSLSLWKFFAAPYGDGTYGSGTYNNGVSDAASTGQLADTGVVLVGIAVFACLFVFTALIVRFWKRKSKHYVRNR